MKRGFSLLEVVLAMAILGISLPLIWSYMAEGVNNTAKYVQMVTLRNVEKNVQNIFNETNVPVILNDKKCSYCGYRNHRFAISMDWNVFDGNIFMIQRKDQKLLMDGSIERIVYDIYPWNKLMRQPQLQSGCGRVYQSIIVFPFRYAE